MKCITMLLLASSIVYSITIDPFMLEHSIYAQSTITNNWKCKTPYNGIVGTPGVWDNKGNLVYVRTKAYIGEIDGNNWDVQGDTLTFESFGGATSFNVINGGYVDSLKPVYDVEPIFPDLSGVTFYGVVDATNGVYIGGQYKDLNPSFGQNVVLMAGIYHFENINIGWGEKVTIIPNNSGSYFTEIFVKNSISLRSGAKFVVQDSTGYGRVKLCQISNNTILFRSLAEINASIVAEHAEVKFNSKSKLVGQVFADKINLIDFNGGCGIIFKKLNICSPVVISDTVLCLEAHIVNWEPIVTDEDNEDNEDE